MIPTPVAKDIHPITLQFSSEEVAILRTLLWFDAQLWRRSIANLDNDEDTRKHFETDLEKVMSLYNRLSPNISITRE